MEKNVVENADTLLWVLAFLIVAGLFIWRGGNLVARWIRLNSEHRQECERNRHAEAQSDIDLRRREAQIDETTIKEQSELRAAELRQKTAEADAAAQVAAATIADQIAAEREIIAAATRGRAARAEQDALTGPTIDVVAALKVLTNAYNDYNSKVYQGHQKTFPDWLGDVDIWDLLAPNR